MSVFSRIITTLVLLACMSTPALAAETPEQSLRKIQQAIDTRDTALLERCIDLNGVIAGATDIFVETMGKQVASNSKGVSPMLAMLVASMKDGADSQAAQSVRTLVTGETRKFVLHGVASGKFAGKPVKDVKQDGGLFSPLFEGASVSRKEIRSIKNVRRNGDSATASMEVYDHGSENAYPVNVRLVQTGDMWQVREVTNAAELVSRIRTESKQ